MKSVHEGLAPPRGTRDAAGARGARVSVEEHAPRTEAWVPFERARVPRGPPSTAHFKKATGKPRREPHTREHVQRICSWPDRSSSTSAARARRRRAYLMPKNHHDYKYPVEVRATIDMGNGVFATRDIKKGELCCFYDGIIVPSRTGMDGFMSGKLGYGHDYTTESRITMV